VVLAREPVPGGQAGVIEAVSFLGLSEESMVNVGGLRLRAVHAAAGLALGDAVHAGMADRDWLILPYAAGLGDVAC
jgi:hypothetical protein